MSWKQKFLVVGLLMFFVNGFTQNLVRNPSFEDYTQCPFGPPGPSEIIFAQYWGTPPGSITTPDYHHACVIDTGQICPSMIPNTFAGYCEPRTGNAVAGILCHYDFGNYDSREYIQTELESPMISGQCYKVSFWVKLAPYAKYSVNSIGAFFSVDSLQHNGGGLLDVDPIIISDQQLTDNTNWTEITGYYRSFGGERFITIGNFLSDKEISLQFLAVYPNLSCQLPNGGAYYFVDDVSVVPDTLVNCVNEIVLPNVFTPDNDGTNDFFVPTSYIGITSESLLICDRWGQQVFYTEDVQTGWDGTDDFGKVRNAGVYFWILRYTDMKNEEHVYTGTVTLAK